MDEEELEGYKIDREFRYLNNVFVGVSYVKELSGEEPLSEELVELLADDGRVSQEIVQELTR